MWASLGLIACLRTAQASAAWNMSILHCTNFGSVPRRCAFWISRRWASDAATSWNASGMRAVNANPETIVSLHRLVAYVRSVACSLRAFTASVTKSSPPAVLTLDAMLDLCCRCCKGLAWHPEFPSTVIWVTRVMFHLRSLGQRSVSRYFSDPSSASDSLQDFCRCVWF